MKWLAVIGLMVCMTVSKAQEIVVDGIRYYGDWMESATIAAFQDTGLSGDIIIPAGISYEGRTYAVTKFERFAFSECRHIRSVVIPASVNETLYDCGYEFYNCTSLEEVVLSPNMQMLQGTFMGCTSLQRIVIPEGVRYMDYVFANCAALRDVTLPEGLAEVGRECFYGCLSLREITLPASVTSVGTDAFAFCRGLVSVTCKAAVPPSCLGKFGPRIVAVNPFHDIALQAVLYVPADAVESYRITYPWSEFYSIRPITDTSVEKTEPDDDEKVFYAPSGHRIAAPSGLYIQGGKVRYRAQ
jgi:hypothetical protein